MGHSPAPSPPPQVGAISPPNSNTPHHITSSAGPVVGGSVTGSSSGGVGVTVFGSVSPSAATNLFVAVPTKPAAAGQSSQPQPPTTPAMSAVTAASAPVTAESVRSPPRGVTTIRQPLTSPERRNLHSHSHSFGGGSSYPLSFPHRSTPTAPPIAGGGGSGAAASLTTPPPPAHSAAVTSPFALSEVGKKAKSASSSPAGSLRLAPRKEIVDLSQLAQLTASNPRRGGRGGDVSGKPIALVILHGMLDKMYQLCRDERNADHCKLISDSLDEAALRFQKV